jgi:NAD(P)-dependent dehydrogenase (short-subunit alcohol dehydrogenase family)
MKRLDGRVALVTGGASVPGIGSSTAQRFAEEGAVVYVSDIDGAGAEKVAEGIRASGGAAYALTHDVTSEQDWDQAMNAILSKHENLDVLVNNAGIAVLRDFEDLTSADWALQLRVNLDSVFYGTSRAVKAMKKSGKGGAIVNVSSVAALFGIPRTAAYASSKAGVRLFTKVIAVECAKHNIRCNSVHPGMIETNLQDAAQVEDPAVYDAVLAQIPMGRVGYPIDIANMNVFLASDEARYITGGEFVVDGGLSIK